MFPEEIQSLVNAIEDNLRSDLILESDFHGEVHDYGTSSRKKLLFLLQIIILIRHFVLSFLCLFPSNRTSNFLRITCVDLLHGLGSFGCLLNQVFFLGVSFSFHIFQVFRINEKASQLHFISHIRDFRKFNFNEDETKKFTKYLVWIRIQRKLVLYLSALPLTGALIIGSIITSVKLKSYNFAVLSIAIICLYFPVIYYNISATTYGFLMTCHSSTYLSIRFSRVLCQLEKLLENRSTTIQTLGNYKQNSVLTQIQDWVGRARFRIKELEKVLSEVEDVLKEVKRHNQTVKEILKCIVTYLIPAIGLQLIFLASEEPLYQFLDANTAIFITVLTYYTFSVASNVYTLTKQLSIKLYSLQRILTSRHKKLHVLRLIQRTSDCKTWNLPIGFTVGDQGSFSPLTTVSSLLQSVSIPLTFLNARSTWKY